MKKKFSFAICTAILIILSMPILVVTAMNNESEILFANSIDSETSQNIDSALATLLRERNDTLEYSLSSASKAEDSGDFTGYDVSGGYAVYNVAFLGKTEYKRNETFQNFINNEPVYMIPYNNSNGFGMVWMYNDNGNMTLIKSVQSDIAAFDFEDIAARVSKLDNVTEIKLMQDWNNYLNIVYIVANNEEYVIPYIIGDPMKKIYGSDLPVSIYRASDFIEWVNNAFDWENVADAEMYGGITYIGYQAQPLLQTQFANVIPLSVKSVIMIISFIIGMFLVGYALIHCIKIKQVK